ncbi:protein RST1 isoform X2 [Coffea arabica]|uniref:Protein RST1 isoform X2 n=1 Tax=Coffea arabica TaxID=13443 RepID=A0A6P6VGK8_COFAR
MDAYNPLLERTRVPQPCLQKFAVISIFEKLRNAPPHLDPDSDPGREAITYCLHSTFAGVVDQSVREVCRLVKDSKMDLSRGLLELQSGLEASGPRFVNLFVKALGFLVSCGFQKNPSSFRFQSPETHPFVKILSCRVEVQCELVQQVGNFMVKNKHLGITKVCDFLRPLLNYSFIQVPVVASFRCFATSLVSSITSLSCSFPPEAIPVIKLLMGCLRFFPRRDAQDLAVLLQLLECTVDAYVVVLRQLVGMRLLVHEVQFCGLELVEAIFSLHKDLRMHLHGVENISEMSRHLLAVQKDLGLSYLPDFSSVILSLIIPLIQSELEQEHIAILKVLLFLLEWKQENVYNVTRAASNLNEELLFIFPVINIMSSPSIVVKKVAVAVISSLENIFIDLLVSTRSGRATERKFPSISTPGCIIYRFLHHLWFQDPSSLSCAFYLKVSSTESYIDEGNDTPKSCTSLLRDYSLQIAEKKKSIQPLSMFQQIFISDTSFFLGAIASVLLMHQKLGNCSIDLLAVTGNMNPELGVSLMLVILFCIHAFSTKDKDIDFHSMLLKLLAKLPSLASHSAMLPLIVQTVTPMLHKDAKPVLYATATRLICKTWEINDRVFGNLQGVLGPQKFVEMATKKDVCISMAASVRDVCRKDPDRGVDLILSVEACIENEDPLVQSLGFQSLAHLCEADVIDFYTAWDVIAKHVLRYTSNAVVAYSLCLLLRWGAMDAEAYPEPASEILKILWVVGTSRNHGQGSLWATARATAFIALAHYEVVHIFRSIPDFRDVNLEFLFSETDPEVLRAVEGFESRIINHEYMNRRRYVNEQRVSKSNVEKLLDVFPQVVFPTGSKSRVRELPGAALFCLSFAPLDMINRGMLKDLEEVNAKFENALLEIASSLQLSRNILVALITLQSWKSFMQRWMKVQLMLLDAKAHSTVLDRTSKAANNILKIVRRISDECIPSSAENFALAIGALCSSVHTVKSSASKFLLDWLFQYEHECRQWSAAISLGLVSSCLHVTDCKQKYENIKALLEVLSISKNTLVKGACGVGLGFSCQDLLTRVDSECNPQLEKEHKRQEVELLRNIIGVLARSLCQFAQSSADILQQLAACVPFVMDECDPDISVELVHENDDDLEEDIWGVAGLILGLGSSVSALYRSGANDAVINIKEWIFSCIPDLNPSLQKDMIFERREMVLSVGSCLALPIVVAFCQRVELIDDSEIEQLVSHFVELISELLSVENSGTFNQSLLMVSCVGAGNLLSTIMNGGVHSLKVDNIKEILSLLRKSYSSPHPPYVHLGAILGIVSALGADIGLLAQYAPYLQAGISFDQKLESSRIRGPLLSNPFFEPELTSLVREIFHIAQSSDNNQLQQFAAWGISFLWHCSWFRPPQKENTFEEDAVGSVSQRLPKDSLVIKVSLWLMHLDPGMQMGATSNVVSVITALRCLSYASRLPKLDWGAIIRRCMRYEDQVAKLCTPESSVKKGVVRQECLLFSLSHANQFHSLLVFLDELSDLSRFRTLDLNLQSCLLLHLADLIKIFSLSRVEKLFDDVTNYFSWLVSSEQYSTEEKSLLRASCWKGLYLCLDEEFLDAQHHMSNLENCMKMLFAFLPAVAIGESCSGILKEWSEAVRCLRKANQGWLLDLLKAPEGTFMEDNGQFFEVVKKIQAKARLVRIGSIPLNELGRLKACMLNTRSQVIWNVLVEVAATLQHAEESIKRQWLLDTLQISCVTSYPSTALRFLGLLCGNYCKYMPVLVVDADTVLSDLPVTLASVLLDCSFGGVAEAVVLSLWTLTERLYAWALCRSKDNYTPSQRSIDRTEDEMAALLLKVTHHACVLLNNHLPVDKRLELANMVVPDTLLIEM